MRYQAFLPHWSKPVCIPYKVFYIDPKNINYPSSQPMVRKSRAWQFYPAGAEPGICETTGFFKALDYESFRHSLDGMYLYMQYYQPKN